MQQSVSINLDDTKQLIRIGKAFSVEARIEILKLLCTQELNINEIAEQLSIPASSAAAHVRVLEEAGLITTSLKPGIRGSMKLSEKAVKQIEIDLSTLQTAKERTEIIDMPIGNYVDYQVEPTCGLIGEKGPIGEEDEPRGFYDPKRTKAKLLWFGRGYVEYRFPNNILKNERELKMELSMELCSEDHEYNLNWPSDITVWINGIEAGTWTCPGDFGGRRGKLNPAWWPDKNTQYGILKLWSLTESGTFIDNKKVNEKTLREYHLSKQDYISIRIGIKKTAKYQGGINLFGDCFGDYAQNIRMIIYY